LATSGDFFLATCGDFLMAMDNCWHMGHREASVWTRPRSV
jgi:hypothetical protein